MKNFKKILSLLLAAVMCLAVLAGCGGDEQDTDSGDVVVDTSQPDDGARLNLPELDYDGAEINMLVTSGMDAFFDHELQTSDVLKKAVYERNVMVQELLDVSFSVSAMDGTSKGQDAFSSAIRASSMTGGPYDIVVPMQHFGNTLVAEGLYVDLLQQEYIDTSENYWFDGYTDQAKINGKLYTAVSDYLVTAVSNLEIMYMNKEYLDIFGDYIENPYTLIDEGKWTLEKFMEICKAVTVDVDNDTVFDEKDQYGLVLRGYGITAISTACGVNLITKDGDDYYFTLADERGIDVFEKITGAFNQNYIKFIREGVTMYDSFDRGRAMFHKETVGVARQLKTTPIDYGILLPPKLNEEDDYRVGASYLQILAIPTGMTDIELERASAVLQAASYYSHLITIPAYFETCIKGQSAQDIQSYEMLERIRERAYFDVGLIYSRAFPDLFHSFYNAYLKGQHITTFWAGNEAAANRAFDTFLGNFEDKK